MNPRTLADAVLVLHAVFIAFVMAGLLLVLVGGVCHWRWVRNRWFRLIHLTAIGLVVAQAWLGIACPLTVLEGYLRRQAGQSGYELGFIADRVQRVIFYNAPSWVFAVSYTLFAVGVLASFWRVPPRWRPGSVGRR